MTRHNYIRTPVVRISLLLMKSFLTIFFLVTAMIAIEYCASFCYHNGPGICIVCGPDPLDDLLGISVLIALIGVISIWAVE